MTVTSLTAVLPEPAEVQTTEHSGRLMRVREVAKMLGVSSRHIYRLADGGRMPRPMKLGGACRWDRRAIVDWIDGGCRPVGRGK